MLSEVTSFKANSPEKELSKKMILVAKDYVHYLGRTTTSVDKLDGHSNQDVSRVDGGLGEFVNLSHLLGSLKDDLRCATTIFLEEFIACGGVECILNVLRQSLSQMNQNSSTLKGRQQQIALRKATVEQHDCLLCLKYVMKSSVAIFRVTDDAHGLSSIASCVMSSSPKTRILALEVLRHVLEQETSHGLILEALTANRVLFGEPVRFKFLVSMLHGNIASDKAEFQCAGLKFLNALLKTSSKPAERVRLQCELEEAGLDISSLETALRYKSIPHTEEVWAELDVWIKSYLDMENVTGEKHNLESQNEKLHKEITLLRQALQKLEEDKINLMHIEMELKEKCEDLNEEVTTLKTGMNHQKNSVDFPKPNFTKRKELNYRQFGDDEEEIFISGDHGQLETEEIFIDVPTIRPPIEFRSDPQCDLICSNSIEVNSKSTSTEDPKVLNRFFTVTTTSSLVGFGTKQETSTNNSDKESADSALSESESDSGINWSYPEIPETTSFPRNGRPKSRLLEDADPNVFFRCPRLSSNPKLQRSRSEDRRDSTESRSRVLCDGETKVVESSGFFMIRRPETDQISRHSSLPTRELNRYSSNPVTPSYQLPVAYRNNFLGRGHSNCDLYSGIAEKEVPPIPPPDYTRGCSVANSGGTISALVHREITKAVRQISGWI